MTFALLALIAGIGQAPVPPPPSWSPALDCARRVYAIDGLICDDAKLLADTRAMEAVFARAMTSAAPERALQLTDEQQAWNRQRNMCAFERKARACVLRLQKQRIKALSAG